MSAVILLALRISSVAMTILVTLELSPITLHREIERVKYITVISIRRLEDDAFAAVPTLCKVR